MVNVWRKVNHHEVVYDRNYNQIEAIGETEQAAQNHGMLMLLNFAPCYRRGAEIALLNGDSLPKRSAEGLSEPIQLRASYVENPWDRRSYLSRFRFSRLPIRTVRRQDSESDESAGRHESCSGAMVQRGLELKGGRLPRFGIIPT
jgi:hypothetical protein